MVEELVEEPARPLPTGPEDFSGAAWAQAGVHLLNRRRRRSIAAPSRSQRLRVAAALDEFARAAAPAPAAIADPELVYAAELASDRGPDVRSDAMSMADAYAMVKPVIGGFRREQTRLTLERLRER